MELFEKEYIDNIKFSNCSYMNDNVEYDKYNISVSFIMDNINTFCYIDGHLK